MRCVLSRFQCPVRFRSAGTCCRDKAQSATSLRLNDRKQAVSPKCSHAVRGSRVYRKRICSTEVSALRRPPGACGRDAACAVCFRCFYPAAAFARKIHNRQLCLISCGTVPDSALLLNITAHYGYSRCLGSFPFLGTGLKVTPCGTLPPPHSRPVVSHMGRRLSPTTAPKLLPSFRSSFGLRLSACRLTVSTLRHTEVSRRGVPPRSAERTAKPTAESCDICAIVTTSSL